MKSLKTACAVGVEVTLLLFLVLIVLAPFHARSTRHLTVTQTVDATLAEVSGDVRGLDRGDRVTVYRFNYNWKAPIGEATVEEVMPESARIRIDPRDFTWPVGRHGTVSHEADGRSYVSLGKTQGFSEGETLNLFRDRVNIGQAQILHVEDSRSEIRIPIGVETNTGSLTASEFTYATQVGLFKSPLLSSIEVSAIVLALFAYALMALRAKRSPLIVLGERLRRIRVRRGLAFWVVHLVVGVPFTWFLAKMPLYLGAYFVSYVSSHLFAHYLYPYSAINAILPFAYGIIAILYYGYLGFYRKSPVIAFWKLISYRGKSTIGKVSFKRGLVLWALHLVIVYAFGSTLLSFLKGDIAAAIAIGFPAPTIEAAFEQAKYAIWALTVVGVLIGYGYSVLSILWGKYIRNLDFTVTGWLTNGFCYPFLGVVIWQMTPGFTGIDPIITGGPLLYLMLVLGLVLNLLYMLSIFNLGILFDLMTDKGVRTSGFYSVIRHPNYTLEACMFFVTELVGLATGVQWLGLSMYLFLYWIRSEREDNFMEYSNPDYAAYQKATPWKFIPGIY